MPSAPRRASCLSLPGNTHAIPGLSEITGNPHSPTPCADCFEINEVPEHVHVAFSKSILSGTMERSRALYLACWSALYETLCHRCCPARPLGWSYDQARGCALKAGGFQWEGAGSSYGGFQRKGARGFERARGGGLPWSDQHPRAPLRGSF